MARQRDAKGRYLPGKSGSTAVLTPPKRRKSSKLGGHGCRRITAPKQLKNHFVLVCDASGSMNVHREGAARLFNEQVDIVQNAKDQLNTVTVFHFGTRDKDVKEVMYNASPNTVTRLSRSSYPAEGNTPLYDAVIQAGQRALCDMDSEKSYVMVVLTDGEENSSKHNSAADLQNFIRKQQSTDRWTFVFLVPRGYKANFVKISGVHEGNVREWENIDKAREELLSGTAAYFSSRTVGLRSTKNWFTTDLSKVTTRTMDGLKEVTDEVDMWTVEKESNIKSFVDYKSGGRFEPGRSFFEIMKKETQFQDYKKLLLMDKTTKKIYADGKRSVRSVCGFPDTGDVAIEPGNHGNFVLLAQSMSYNRILPRGTRLAFWANV